MFYSLTSGRSQKRAGAGHMEPKKAASAALSRPPRRLVSTFARITGRAVDLGLLRLMRHPSRMPKPEDYARVHDEIMQAHALYVNGGHARDFHVAPPPIETVYMAPGFHPRVRYEKMWFDSAFLLDERDGIATRYARYARNQKAHAWVVRHKDPTRPWLVCLHGLGTGGPVRDFSAFRAHILADQLGLNLIFPVLPMHGPRRDEGLPLGALVSFELAESFHGIRQAVLDTRRILAWLRRQGASRIGIYGMSVGAYVGALVSGLEPLDFLMAGIPLCDLPDLFVHHASMIERQRAEDLEVLGKPLRELYSLISPLAVTPLVPKELRYVYAANEDQVTTAEQAERLWEHWDRPRMRWFSGGHVSFYWSSAVDRFVSKSLIESGFVPPRG
jgi:hypothetical protein